MTARKLFTAAGMTAVAGVAGAISYRHQQHLAVTHGQTYALSLIWPLCVDGLVSVTAIAMSTDRADGYRPRLWALAGFWLGVAVSVATNWLATDGGVIAHCVSAFPALAFLLAIESLSSKPRARKAVNSQNSPTDQDANLHLEIAEISVVDDAPRRARSTVKPTTATRPRAPRSDSKADAVAKVARRNPTAKPAVIAVKAGVSDATARRHLKSDSGRTGTSADDLVPSAGEVINGHDHDLFADLSS